MSNPRNPLLPRVVLLPHVASEDQVPRVTKALLDFQCLHGLSSSSLEAPLGSRAPWRRQTTCGAERKTRNTWDTPCGTQKHYDVAMGIQ